MKLLKRLKLNTGIMRAFGNGRIQSVVKGFRMILGAKVYIYPAKSAFKRVR